MRFFKEFVKCGMDDARYYELIYTMLTHRLNDNFPLGFAMSEQDGFNDKVLAKLPSKIQKQLKSYTLYVDDEDTDRRLCYSLLTGNPWECYNLEDIYCMKGVSSSNEILNPEWSQTSIYIIIILFYNK